MLICLNALSEYLIVLDIISWAGGSMYYPVKLDG